MIIPGIITLEETNTWFIIRSPSLFFWWISSESEALSHFQARAIARRTMRRILFAAKQSWTTLRMSRPLFVGSYLQVTWWALCHEKEEKFATKDKYKMKVIAWTRATAWTKAVLKWFQDQRAYKSRDSRYPKNTDTFKSPFILALTEGRNNRCHVPKTFSERKSMKLSWDIKRRKFRIMINTNKFSCGQAYLHVNFTCNAASTTCNNWSGKKTRNPLLYKNVSRA